MLPIIVKGSGLIPRGHGIAPKLFPFPATMQHIYLILSTRGLSVEFVDPDTNAHIPINRTNLQKIYESYQEKLNIKRSSEEKIPNSSSQSHTNNDTKIENTTKTEATTNVESTNTNEITTTESNNETTVTDTSLPPNTDDPNKETDPSTINNEVTEINDSSVSNTEEEDKKDENSNETIQPRSEYYSHKNRHGRY
jgi:hypothetical protein